MKPINPQIVYRWSDGSSKMFKDAKECTKHGCNNARSNLRCDPDIPCIVNQETGVFVTMMTILEEADDDG